MTQNLTPMQWASPASFSIELQCMYWQWLLPKPAPSDLTYRCNEPEEKSLKLGLETATKDTSNNQKSRHHGSQRCKENTSCLHYLSSVLSQHILWKVLLDLLNNKWHVCLCQGGSALWAWDVFFCIATPFFCNCNGRPKFIFLAALHLILIVCEPGSRDSKITHILFPKSISLTNPII